MSVPTPLVSIIVPCYNAAPWLEETLESALAQTWPRTEIILVDDGSTDGSREIAHRFAARGVRVLAQVNGGAASARNRGIAAARGDYLQFLDADDLLAPNKLEKQITRLGLAGPAFVATCAWARFRTRPNEARFNEEPLWRDLGAVDWLVCSWRQHAMMATAAWLIPRGLAERAGPWNTELDRNPVDDMEYFSRVLLAGEGVCFCGEARIYYRSSLQDSLSQLRSDEAWRNIFESFQLTATRLLQREDSPRTRLAAASALQRLIYEAYPRVPFARHEAENRIAALGGVDLTPFAGPWRRRLHRVIGWRATKRLHDWFYRRR